MRSFRWIIFFGFTLFTAVSLASVQYRLPDAAPYTPDMARVAMLDVDDVPPHNAAVPDNHVYTSVPEPPVIVLLIIGMLGLVFTRRHIMHS